MVKEIRKYFLIIALIFPLIAFAQELKGGVDKAYYSDYLEQINLSEKQKKQILKIRNEESYTLKPISLEIEAKEQGLMILDSMKCNLFDKACKTRLKEEKELIEFELNELLRKTAVKKNYYKIRYRNTLTREQDIKIQQLIKDNEHKDKVIKERIEKEKSFWNKFKRNKKSA